MAQFRVLGPVEIWCGDERLHLADSRELKILVALVLDLGHVVSLSRLVDAVWDDQPPHTATKAVRNGVSALRRLMAGAGVTDEVIATDSGGYALRVAPHQVDLHTFASLAAQGRGLATAGQLAPAVAALRAALAVWRGAAFTGMIGRFVAAAATRLEEQRLAVQEECLSHELALGHDHQLIDELSTMVATQPLRERPRGQLMRALSRSGRRDEALRIYRDGRSLLAAELGIEPGPELTGLHQTILAGGEPHVSTGRSDTHPTPAQLPPDLSVFTGRTAQLAELHALLNPDGSAPTMVIATVSGTAGVGKSALAVRWAHQIANRFPDGQLYVNLRGFDPTGQALTPAAAIRGFLDALGVSPQRVPASLEAQAALYRSLLAGQRILVLLDNARDAEQVRPLLPGARGCLAVVTSRDQLGSLVAVDGAHPLVLDLLPADEARELLAGRLGDHRVVSEAEAVAEIIDRSARLPLALAIVAARAATHPLFSLDQLALELREARGGLDPFDRDRTTGLRTVLSWSYQALSPAAARLFRLLGAHPGRDIAAPAAASLVASSLVEVRPVLSELAGAHLLIEHIPGRFTCHDLLRAYAVELVHAHETDEERQSAVRRILDHYLRTACHAALLLSQDRDPPALGVDERGVILVDLADSAQALAWFVAEHSVLLSTITQAAARGIDSHTWKMAWALADFFQWQGHWNDLIDTQTMALAATRRLADRVGQAAAHCALAGAHTWLNRYDEAITHLSDALDLYGQLGNDVAQARTHVNLALVVGRHGRHADALDHAQQAFEIYQIAGDRFGQADALNAIGWCHTALGDHHQAIAFCEKALPLHRELGHRDGEGSTHDSLGLAYHHLGNYRHAIVHYGQALVIMRDLGQRYYEADTLSRLGDTQQAVGDIDDAQATWRQALEILTELDHPDADQIRDRISG